MAVYGDIDARVRVHFLSADRGAVASACQGRQAFAGKAGGRDQRTGLGGSAWDQAGVRRGGQKSAIFARAIAAIIASNSRQMKGTGGKPGRDSPQRDRNAARGRDNAARSSHMN